MVALYLKMPQKPFAGYRVFERPQCKQPSAHQRLCAASITVTFQKILKEISAYILYNIFVKVSSRFMCSYHKNIFTFLLQSILFPTKKEHRKMLLILNKVVFNKL